MIWIWIVHPLITSKPQDTVQYHIFLCHNRYPPEILRRYHHHLEVMEQANKSIMTSWDPHGLHVMHHIKCLIIIKEHAVIDQRNPNSCLQNHIKHWKERQNKSFHSHLLISQPAFDHDFHASSTTNLLNSNEIKKYDPIVAPNNS